MSFSLLTDPWVNVVGLNGQQECMGLGSAISQAERLTDIAEPPMTRLAILRLLLAMQAAGDLEGNWDIRDGFLQVDGLPASSARLAIDVLTMQDGNGVALSPTNDPTPTDDATLAKALITAFMCDRGGLKARAKGLPISAATPLHVGQLIAFRRGETLADFLELNAIPPSTWVPWWKRPVNYDDPWDGDMVHYLLWPWRRVQVIGAGRLVVAAGVKFSGLESDPWSLGRAGLRHLGGIDANYDADITAIVLSQASPVAAWVARTP